MRAETVPMLWIAERGCTPSRTYLGPGGAPRVLQQAADESPAAFAARVGSSLGGSEGVVVFLGGPDFDGAVQRARVGLLSTLARRAEAHGEELWVDVSAASGRSRHSLLALADVLGEVGPRPGVRVLERGRTRPAPVVEVPVARAPRPLPRVA